MLTLIKLKIPIMRQWEMVIINLQTHMAWGNQNLLLDINALQFTVLIEYKLQIQIIFFH